MEKMPNAGTCTTIELICQQSEAGLQIVRKSVELRQMTMEIYMIISI